MSQAFDTLAYSKRAQAAGISPQQAEFFATEMNNLIDEKLVTKDFLDVRLEKLKNDLIIKMGSMLSLAVGLIIGILGFLQHH